MGILIGVVVAIVVFWLVAHISLLLAVVAALLVLVAFVQPWTYGRGPRV